MFANVHTFPQYKSRHLIKPGSKFLFYFYFVGKWESMFLGIKYWKSLGHESYMNKPFCKNLQNIHWNTNGNVVAWSFGLWINPICSTFWKEVNKLTKRYHHETVDYLH